MALGSSSERAGDWPYTLVRPAASHIGPRKLFKAYSRPSVKRRGAYFHRARGLERWRLMRNTSPRAYDCSF